MDLEHLIHTFKLNPKDDEVLAQLILEYRRKGIEIRELIDLLDITNLRILQVDLAVAGIKYEVVGNYLINATHYIEYSNYCFSRTKPLSVKNAIRRASSLADLPGKTLKLSEVGRTPINFDGLIAILKEGCKIENLSIRLKKEDDFIRFLEVDISFLKGLGLVTEYCPTVNLLNFMETVFKNPLNRLETLKVSCPKIDDALLEVLSHSNLPRLSVLDIGVYPFVNEITDRGLEKLVGKFPRLNQFNWIILLEEQYDSDRIIKLNDCIHLEIEGGYCYATRKAKS